MATFDFDGKKVYYEDYGAGKPIIVLNGIMMSTNSWKPFVADFSRSNRCILVDFFDQGQSSRMTSAYDHSIQVELLYALYNHLKLTSACVMGISYGGEVAIQFAVKYGNLVEKLLLFNTCARTSSWLKKIGDGWNEVAKLNSGYAYYLTTIPIIYSTEFFISRAEWMDNREKTLTEYFARDDVRQSLIRLTDSSRDYDYVDRLSEISCPTLIVSGGVDALVPKEEQLLLHQKIKGSCYVTINGSGHASMYESPLAFASLVVGFCNVSSDLKI